MSAVLAAVQAGVFFLEHRGFNLGLLVLGLNIGGSEDGAGLGFSEAPLARFQA
jgi:hypothetical protein